MNRTTAFFSVTFAVVLFAILSLDTTYDRHNGVYSFKAPSVSTLNTKEYSQSILQNSEKDIVFIENLGQIKDTKGEKRPDILFLTRSQGVDMYMTNLGITYVFRNAESSCYRLDMEFVGMNKNINIKKELAVEQQFNYYTPEYPNGISPKAYKKLTIENIYEDIDLVYYEKEGRMKYDFIIKAGADAGKIKMKYKGARSIDIDNNGSVIVTTPMGEIREGKPYTYSRNTGSEIESRYQVKNNMVLFDIAEYDESEDIIIDPIRIWATYYGGSGYERGFGICTDNSGNLYVTGRTSSSNFPTQTLTGAYNQTTYGGGGYDAFILKFNSSGARIWATYYGGSGFERGNGICTDNSGNLYVTGKTASSNFPTQTLTGAYNQTTYGGGNYDAFILKFNNSGARIWATYYGGSGTDGGWVICTDNSGNLYVTGGTTSSNFPTQTLTGAYNQTTYGGGIYDAFILKFDSSCVRQWASYYGGSDIDDGRNVSTDNSGNLYVTGNTESSNFPTLTLTGAYNQATSGGSSDAFILKFDSSCVRQWASYYGGSGTDVGWGICTDNSGNLNVTGETESSNFPTQTLTGAYNQTTSGGSLDAFILKFNSSCVRQWASYYGGSDYDRGRGICTDNSGNLYVTGRTESSNFPTQTLTGAYNQTTSGGSSDAFILNFNSSCVRQWASYYGGSDTDRGWGICTDNSGNLYVTGNTFSSNFPTLTLTGAYNKSTLDGLTDAFILWFYGLNAAFTASDETICEGDTVSFTDQSYGNVISWDWTFEGGTPPTSTLQSPTVTYNTTGTFDVQLIISDGLVFDTLLKVDFITVIATPAQTATPAGPIETCGGDTYEYTTNPVDFAYVYAWDIDPDSAGVITGDDTVGTFVAEDNWNGDYTVTVRAENECGDSPWSAGLQATLYHTPLVFQQQGEGGYCDGDPGIEITLDGSETGVDYELFIDDTTTGIIVAGTGSAISFGYQTEEGLYTSMGYTSHCSEIMTGQSYIYVVYPCGQAATPTGPDTVCNYEISVYSTAGAANADTLMWTLTPPEAGVLYPTGFNTTIQWDDDFTGNASLSVQGQNMCGTGLPSDELEIDVNDAPTPVITGPDTVCDYEQADYSTPNNPGSIYTWNVVGGTIITGAGTYLVTVEWGQPGTGYIKVSETSSSGCHAATEYYEVTIELCPGIEEHLQFMIRAYPIPVHKAMILEYQLDQTVKVELVIYNHTGQRADILISQHQQQGPHQVSWDASGFPAGIYFYRLQAGNQSASGKMIVVK